MHDDQGGRCEIYRVAIAVRRGKEGVSMKRMEIKIVRAFEAAWEKAGFSKIVKLPSATTHRE